MTTTKLQSPSTLPFHTWASTLTNDFPNDIIPIGAVEDDWQSWGNIVASSPTFLQAGVPRTDSFMNWRDWAERLYAVLG